MTRTRFILVVLLSAAIGFAVGWFARQAMSPDLEERARDAAYQFLERLRGK